MPRQQKIPKVLIVDDTWNQRQRLKTFFLSIGCDVVSEAENGLEGVRMFESYEPDLVTMDINMPYMGGIEALIEIMKHNRSAVVIMVSAMGDPVTIKEAKKIGATDFVVKPYTEEELKNAVRKSLKKSFPKFLFE